MHLFPGHSCTPPTANWGFWFILIQIRYSCLVYAVLLVASFWLSIVDLLFFQTYIFSDVVFIFTVVLLLLTFCLYTPTLSNVRPLPMDRTTTGSFWGTILVNKSSRTDMLWIGIGSPIILSIIILLCVLLFYPRSRYHTRSSMCLLQRLNARFGTLTRGCSWFQHNRGLVILGVLLGYFIIR